MATETTVTLETLDKELKAIRKELRKIKAHIDTSVRIGNRVTLII